MSWSDTANLGVAVTAPACYWRGFGFYQDWIVTMVTPVRCGFIQTAHIQSGWLLQRAESSQGPSQCAATHMWKAVQKRFSDAFTTR